MRSSATLFPILLSPIKVLANRQKCLPSELLCQKMARYSPNSLFRSGENVHLNACIGTNGGPYDYGDFSHGYFSAANHLVNTLRDGDHPGLFTDTSVYPIVSNYRHGLELGLKHCIIVVLQILRRPGDFPKTHELDKLWNQFKGLETEFDSGLMPDEDREFFSEVIRDFTLTDPIGMVFRYPEDRQRNLQIDEFELLNLDVLGEAMKRVQSILETLDAYLGQIAEYATASSRSTPYPRAGQTGTGNWTKPGA